MLARLRGIALEGRWPPLFREILVGTGVQSRILADEEGDRHWMDLRQTMQHALEFLVLGRGGIPELLEHLRRLARGDETAADDRNLHARATDRGRVQILTMHVSKGLEFPVVFLSPSAKPRRKDQNRWIAEREGRLRLHVAPKECGKDDPSLLQAEEECRRLLYVALTRPKLLLVSPCFGGRRKPDDILSLRLAAAVESPPEGVLVEPPLPAPSRIGARSGTGTPSPAPERRDPSSLALRERSLVLSSYSAIARSAAAGILDGRPQRAEEMSESVTTPSGAERPDAWLPRGAASGDALHELLELLLRRDDLAWCRDAAEPPAWLLRDASGILAANGLDPALSDRAARLAVDVLASELPLPGGACARLCDLPRAHRRPEVEFHCAFDGEGRILDSPASTPRRGWLVGYVDLLFRHDGRWYVLDWKTTSLPGWDPESLDHGMLEHDYALQASLYARVLASARPRVECGGAVYVFLRAFADASRADTRAGVWTATPGDLDTTPVGPRLERWLQARRGRTGRGGDAP